jgi:hypothetical protein
MAEPVADSSISLPDLANEGIASLLESGDSSLAIAMRRVHQEIIGSNGYYAAFGNAPTPRSGGTEDSQAAEARR